MVDFTGPVLRLQSLTPEELRVLLAKLRDVFALGDPDKELVPLEALEAFMVHCNERIGEAYFRTPRTSIKAFVQLLSVLDQNPGTDWRGLIGQAEIEPDMPPDTEPNSGDDDELTDLKL